MVHLNLLINFWLFVELFLQLSNLGQISFNFSLNYFDEGHYLLDFINYQEVKFGWALFQCFMYVLGG